ncbi:MAG: electron transport complex subunit RsxC [Lachnospiraceae bacterium]|nr:electron transport complex subunit RsxC [Lachnospiraceae bacterium]
MKKKEQRFPGGVHPTDGSDKKLSKDAPIVSFMPEIIELSMSQSGGSLCEPLVAVGDHVERGQLVGQPKNFTAVRLHASVSGVVTEIRMEKKGPMEVPLLVIEPDKEQPEGKEQPYQKEWMSVDDYTKEDLISIMEEAGITGMGGAGFPAHVKYKTDKPIEYILINACECESYLTCDYRMMLEHGMEILNGVNVLLKAGSAKKAIICTEDNKMDCVEHLRKLLAGCKSPIEVMAFPTKYPQGGERQLIQAATGKELQAGGLPADAGVIVSNVQTAKAMGDAVFGGTPCISRCITVTGLVRKPGNFLVPLGTPLRELLQKCGGPAKLNNKAILGGPMTGSCIGHQVRCADLGQSVTKVSGGLLILFNEGMTESPCIRCGSCMKACPAGLTPWKIDFAIRKGNVELCHQLYATECIGCGCCSYVCPARRELSQNTVKARNDVRAMLRERGAK